MRKRVVVTGVGVVSPVGNNKDSFWSNLVNGVSGIGPISRFDVSDFSTRIAGEIKDFDPKQFMDRKEIRHMDRFTQYAVAAAKMAMEDADLALSSIERERTGVVLGSGIGGVETMEDQKKVLLARGPGRISPFFVPMMISNMAAGQVSIALGALGPNETVVTACASGTNAVGDAFKMIQRGDADVVIAGGTEAPLTPLSLAGFCAMKALSTRNEEPQRASRPFDSGRDGFVMAEGAGILILESLEHAEKRGARIYAEMAGYGATADGYHITAPDPEGDGAARAMAKALDDAGLEPGQIDYINAHGTSTPLGDIAEIKAIKSLFGDHAYKLNISSTKSMAGHLLGGTAAIEALACVMAVTRDIVPTTINVETLDPEIDPQLNLTLGKAQKREVRSALSNTFGFGGHNSSIIFRKI